MRLQYLIVLLVSLLFAISGLTTIVNLSGTCDEISHHIPAGYSYYLKGDFRLNPSNPPLSRYIMAFPLLFLDLKASFEDESWKNMDAPEFGRKFFFVYNRKYAGKILFFSRLMMLLIGLLGGVGVYYFAKSIWGVNAGVFAFSLYSLLPEVIAHSTLATTDITASCFIIFSLFSFLCFLKKPNFLNGFSATIFLGLAQLSKYTSLLLYPLFFLFSFFEYLFFKNKGLFKKVLVIFLSSLIVIWAGYGFRLKPFLKEARNPQEKIAFVKGLGSHLLGRFWNEALSEKVEEILKGRPLPLTTYITGLFGVIRHSRGSILIYDFRKVQSH